MTTAANEIAQIAKLIEAKKNQVIDATDRLVLQEGFDIYFERGVRKYGPKAKAAATRLESRKRELQRLERDLQRAQARAQAQA